MTADTTQRFARLTPLAEVEARIDALVAPVAPRAVGIATALGHVLAADVTVAALDRAGPNLTTETLIKGLESIDGYHDIFGGGVISFSKTKHQGSNSSFVAVVKGGRWTKITDPVSY